jgi:DNA polymerase III alpha subunit (gram-positive type)
MKIKNKLKKGERTKVFLDIETFANEVYTWGIYEQNAIAKKKEWFLMSYSYKVDGEKTTHVVALPDFKKSYKKDKSDDRELALSLWHIFDKYDVIIAHNADFDVKKSCARFFHHGFPPPSPYEVVCTKKLAKSRFKMDSNKLDHIGEYTELGRKIKHEGFDLACREGNMAAWGRMKKYNKQDVVLLEKIYQKMLPWSKTAPKLYHNSTCKHCGSDEVQLRGVYYSRKPGGRRFICKECGIWGHTFITAKPF